MNNSTYIKFSSHFVLVACLSGGLTIGLSLVYILLCIAALISRVECANGESAVSESGASYFWKTIFSAYILKSECAASQSALQLVKDEITGEYTVFVLTAITLCVSVLCLVTAITLIIAVQNDGAVCNINVVVFPYVGSCIASLVVDLTTATHFGLDYSYLSTALGTWGNNSNYKTEVLRQGAFLLMSIALKGYVALAINFILLILLVVYVVEHRKLLKSDQHSIHKLGVLTAYDQPRKPEDNWSTVPQPDMFSPFARGAQSNNGFIKDDDSPPSPRREPTRPDYNYSNRSFDRSESWHRTHANAAPNSRPFTYLEDVKRSVPTRPPTSPAVEAPWRRDPWPQVSPVHVPAPDYSPQPARRLKSALKPV